MRSNPRRVIDLFLFLYFSFECFGDMRSRLGRDFDSFFFLINGPNPRNGSLFLRSWDRTQEGVLTTFLNFRRWARTQEGFMISIFFILSKMRPNSKVSYISCWNENKVKHSSRWLEIQIKYFSIFISIHFFWIFYSLKGGL